MDRREECAYSVPGGTFTHLPLDELAPASARDRTWMFS